MTTSTHVYVTIANPYLTCDQRGGWVTGWHDEACCGCHSHNPKEPA